MKQSGKTFSHSGNEVSNVSKKFHAYIHSRIREACELCGQSSVAALVAVTIDGYIAAGVMPPADADAVCLMIFTLLRPEIDRAKERSASARRRAAVRRSASRDGDVTPRAVMATTEIPVEKITESEASCVAEPDMSVRSFPNRRARRRFLNDMKRRGRTRIKPLTSD